MTALHVFDTWSTVNSTGTYSQPPSRRTSADGGASIADDASDTASEASGAYTASSAGQSRVGRVAVGQWCQQHSVNNKVMGITDANR